MCFTGLLCVLGAAWLFGLDRGMAAGLAAGGLTQSAIIGTAGDAIGKLGLSPDLIKTMQTNVAVGYAVCYIFGSLGPIIMVSWFLPLIMRWNIRAEAVKLGKRAVRRPPRTRPGSVQCSPADRNPHLRSHGDQQGDRNDRRWRSTGKFPMLR